MKSDLDHPFSSGHVVLVEPEIPQNTGSIGRLCLATSMTLHLVKPLGFDISDRQLKRAGLDYWPQLKVVTHESLEEYLEVFSKVPKVFFTKKAGHTLYEHSFLPETHLIFGKETAGLSDWVIQRYAQDCLRIPLYDARVRSLNLSNAVSIAVYEMLRQQRFSGQGLKGSETDSNQPSF